MAGVGFELKKLFRSKEGYFRKMRGFAVSAAVTQGPMMLNILMLFLMRFLMDQDGAAYLEEEWLLYTVTYTTIFSLILSNTVLMFIDRYVSDCIYKEETERILPSFHGLMVLLLLLGGGIALMYLIPSPRNLLYKLLVLVQFLLLLIIWLEMSYMSALKQYGKVLVGFFVSVIVAVGLGIVLIIFTDIDRVNAALFAITAGYAVMMVMFYQQMLIYYPRGKTDLFGWMSALDDYRILIVIGFFMGLGLYTHNFAYWFSSVRNDIWDWGVFCTKYDVPAFYATLTVTPMLVMFVVSVETKVYRQYREYFDAVLHGGTLQNIVQTRRNMETVIFRELGHMVTMQLFISIISATVFANMLKGMGLDGEQTAVFRTLCFGYCLYGLAKCQVILMLYFEDRKGALTGAGLFLITSSLFSVINLHFDITLWGLGYLFAAFITAIYGSMRLKYFLARLEYKVFLRQPLFMTKNSGPFVRFAENMTRHEREVRRKMNSHRKRHRRKK